MIQHLKDSEKQEKSLRICAELLIKRAKRMQRDAIQIWKVNWRKLKCRLIDHKLEHLDTYEANARDDLKDRAELLSLEVPRTRHKKLMVTIFMAFKKSWVELEANKRKIEPARQKMGEHRVKNAMTNWKWLLHYKRTKRGYLHSKKL